MCFVAGALAGEVVTARQIARHARHDDYEATRIESPSPDRVVPRCPLVGRCGGCDLQHLDARAQVAHKQAVVQDVLRRQAHLEAVHVDPPIDSQAFHYRVRARLAVEVPRRQGVPVLGFREAAGTRVVEVDHCDVLTAALADLPRALNALLRTLDEPRALGHVDLAISETSDDRILPVVGLRTVAAPGDADVLRWRRFAEHHDAYLTFDDGAAVREMYAPDPEPIGYRLPDFGLRLSFVPGDFLQGNAAVNRALVTRLVEVVGDVAGAEVLDAFSGLGNFSLPLARRGARVLGVEAVADMVARARDNAARHGIDTADFAVRDLHEANVRLPREKFDVAVLDPPRDGALALVRQLAARGVPTILYVSCMPASLARDAKVLADAGYRLERFSLVDMFPQTSHIESMALFVRAAAKGSLRRTRGGALRPLRR